MYMCERLVDVCAWQPEDSIVVILLLNAQMEADDFCSLWTNLHHHGQIIKHERERGRDGERQTSEGQIYSSKVYIGLQYKSNTRTHPICKAARGIRIGSLDRKWLLFELHFSMYHILMLHSFNWVSEWVSEWVNLITFHYIK